MKRLTAIAVAVGMLTMVVPTALGTHLSVGFQEAVTNGPQEAPTDDGRSVAGTEIGEDGVPYGVGTKGSEECYSASSNVSPDEANQALMSDAFCGQLLYNEGNSDYEQASQVDQHFPDDFLQTFDVQRAYYVGNALLGTCLPMCDDSSNQVSPQNTTWTAVHTAGSAAGLTEGPEEADEGRDGDRYQSVKWTANVRSAPGLVQEQTGIWEMNGWQIPFATEQWVGYLLAGEGAADAIDGLEEGETVTDQHLKEYVSSVRGDVLDTGAVAKVCGYTPDISFTSTGEQTSCQNPLLYEGTNESAESGEAPFSSYNDRCQTPTYTCGAISGDHWEGEAIGLASYGGQEQLDHIKWHWVVAPTHPDCAAAEPGVLFETAGDAPYLAHDLDVYTPVQKLAQGPPLSTANANAYANSVIGATSEDVGTVVEDVQDPIPELPDQVGDTVDEASGQATDAVNSATDPVMTGSMLEPNHEETEGEVFNDTSRFALSEDRSVTDPCEKLLTSEDEDTVDPWVNYIDNGVSKTAQNEVGLYGTTDSEMDDDNDPTTELYSTSGFLGVFSDKNDNGAYDQVTGPNDASDGFGDGVYQDENIQQTGAYPMLYDMQVELEDGEAKINTDQGCQGPGSQPFALTMEEAGYGPNTGLVQAIYLAEPTVWTNGDAADPQAVPYTGGNNIYVVGNQPVHKLWSPNEEDKTNTELAAHVDQLVAELKEYVSGNYDVSESDIGVVMPGTNFGNDDFSSQCGESTGDFSMTLSFAHSCELGCEGDTIATSYIFQVDDSPIGQGSDVPSLNIGGEAHTFGEGMHTWTDIDPFDGDDTRNEERLDPPPTGE